MNLDLEADLCAALTAEPFGLDIKATADAFIVADSASGKKAGRGPTLGSAIHAFLRLVRADLLAQVDHHENRAREYAAAAIKAKEAAARIPFEG